MAIQVGPPLVTLDLTIGQVENLNPQGQAESGINTGVTLNTADTGITLSSGGVIKGGQTAFNTGNGFFLGYSGSQYKVSIGDPSGDNLTWDGADLTITADAGTISGDLTVNGNFTVNGTTTTLNTATLDVEDKNITLNYGSGDTSSTANGAGITIQDAVNSTTDASILWNGTTDAFDFSNSINFGDNDKAIFGAGSDLQIYHNGSHSIIDEAGTGDLFLRSTNGDAVWIYSGGTTSSKKRLAAKSTGEVELYYGSTARLATTSTGIDVTGSVTADGLTVDGTIDSDGTFNPGTSNWTTASFKGTGSYGGGIAFVDGTAGFANYVLSSGATYRIGQGSTSGGLTTHFQISNSGDISFYDSAGTSQSLFWDSSAEALGIGTTSPTTAKLVVDGAANTYTTRVNSSTTTGQAFGTRVRAGTNSSDYALLVENTSAASMLAVRGDGNVGIGTSSPSSNLHVNSGTTNTVATFESTDSTVVIPLIDSVGSTQIRSIDGAFAIRTGGDGGSDANTVEALRIDSSGNVGIGDSSPDRLLHVNGGTENIVARFESTDTATAIEFKDSTGTVTLETRNDFRFKSGSTINAIIDSSGNVGIGTSSPSFPLEVNGGTGDGIKIKAGNTSNDDSFLIANSSNATMFVVDGSGNVGISETDPQGLLHVDGFDYSYFSSNVGPATLDNQQGLAIGWNKSAGGGETVLIANQGAGSAGGMVFATNTSLGSYNEAMRIDSSGNLLVGKTSAAISGAGTAILASGTHNVTVDGDTTLQLNRLSSDGVISTFFKDGDSVGSIGVVNTNNLRIGGTVASHAGIQFGTNILIPESAGSGTNGVVDIGTGSSRFKDLYLSANCRSTSFVGIDDNDTLIRMGGSNVMQFFTANSEHARIDASGNLLVGTTNVNPAANNVTGHALKAGGLVEHANSGAMVMRLNRTDSVGSIIEFRQGTAPVGDIGTRANYIKIGNGDTQLLFNSASDAISPEGETDNRDAAIDLGRSVSRFKNLYLSGGAYLGGTGSANHLDDYEEGTWTPVLKRNGSTNNATITVSGSALYTKVGRMVTLSFYLSAIDYSAVTDGTVASINGIPFTGNTATWFSGSIGYGTSTNASYTTWVLNGTTGYFLNSNNNGFRSGTVDLNRGMFTITYQTS